MKDQSKTKKALIQELISLRQRDSEQEQSESNASGRTQEEDLVPLLNQRLYLLIETVQKLAQVRDLEGIMGVVRSAARALVGSDGSTFVLREGDQCFYADEDAISPLWKGHRFPMSMCISGWVMMNHQIAVIKDIYEDARIPAEAYRPTFVKSLTMVPIRSRDPLGAIGNYWASLHSPTPEEVQLLQTLADATAIAMENVRSYNDQEQRLTERKQAEEDLRVSEERFRILSEAAFEAIAIHEKGVLLNANDQYFKMFGYEPGEALGKQMISLIFAHEAIDFVKQQIATDSLGRYESVGVRKDGTRFPMEIRTRKMEYKGRNVRFGAIHDITDRKRAEEALARAAHEWQGTFDATNDAIWILDKDQRVLRSNKTAEQIFHRPCGEIVGKHCCEIVHGTAQPIPECPILRMKHSLHREKMELQIGERFFEVTVDPILNAAGRYSGAVHIVRDITEHKQAAEKILASLREKEILLNEIHHRVKNNLQVISSLLKLQASASGSPELTERLNESQSRIHAMAMVHEKLYGAKDFTRIDLAGYVRTLSQELFQSHKINQWKITLIVQTDGEVYLDVNKAIPCGLILNELISNALKHAFPGGRQGEIQIIIGETKNTEAEIVVRDNGLGLPVDVDIHAPRSLGLDLVSGLVKNQLDGQIEVRRDKGTQFRIKFPL